MAEEKSVFDRIRDYLEQRRAQEEINKSTVKGPMSDLDYVPPYDLDNYDLSVNTYQNNTDQPMKIVINDEYGGFSLSAAARKKLGIDWDTHEYLEFVGKRNDPALVECVERLGEEANGPAAHLRVVTIPPYTTFKINEEDGREFVEFAGKQQDIKPTPPLCEYKNDTDQPMKIVINDEYGGFGLSKSACKKLGIDWDPHGLEYIGKRNDPKLVECVEKLEKRASGPAANLKVITIPPHSVCKIKEHDGLESLSVAPIEKQGEFVNVRNNFPTRMCYVSKDTFGDVLNAGKPKDFEGYISAIKRNDDCINSMLSGKPIEIRGQDGDFLATCSINDSNVLEISYLDDTKSYVSFDQKELNRIGAMRENIRPISKDEEHKEMSPANDFCPLSQSENCYVSVMGYCDFRNNGETQSLEYCIGDISAEYCYLDRMAKGEKVEICTGDDTVVATCSITPDNMLEVKYSDDTISHEELDEDALNRIETVRASVVKMDLETRENATITIDDKNIPITDDDAR